MEKNFKNAEKYDIIDYMQICIRKGENIMPKGKVQRTEGLLINLAIYEKEKGVPYEDVIEIIRKVYFEIDTSKIDCLQSEIDNILFSLGINSHTEGGLKIKNAIMTGKINIEFCNNIFVKDICQRLFETPINEPEGIALVKLIEATKVKVINTPKELVECIRKKVINNI